MQYRKEIKVWLFIGVIMVFFQVIIGGITRLTESGLSITKWEIISGTLPPLSEEEWFNQYELYKQTPQYKEIFDGMSLADFKFIYFWEYMHRLWARIMGIVFVFPLAYFIMKGWVNKYLTKRLIILFFLAALAASFGWIMVASGLIERPWVNAYKLSLHLCIAACVFGYTLWLWLKVSYSLKWKPYNFGPILNWLSGIFIFQFFLGGVFSGMRAAPLYPTWPDILGEYVPRILFDINAYSSEAFNYYDTLPLMPALIHFSHRLVAYIFFGVVLYFMFRQSRIILYLSVEKRYIFFGFIIAVSVQVCLGIITLLMSKSSVPVLWGVLHQAGAMIVLSFIILLNFVQKGINS